MTATEIRDAEDNIAAHGHKKIRETNEQAVNREKEELHTAVVNISTGQVFKIDMLHYLNTFHCGNLEHLLSHKGYSNIWSRIVPSNFVHLSISLLF